MADLHQKDVKDLLEKSRDIIEEKREKFEKYKVMMELISSIEAKASKNDDKLDEDSEESDSHELETTSSININEFNLWAKAQASKDLSQFKDLTNIVDVVELRSQVSGLNYQQRRIFDDIVEY